MKIDRPINLDGFAEELFEKIKHKGAESESVNRIRHNILQERIDQIDRLNNVRKQYLSNYFMVIYGKNENELENTANSIVSEIGKCGLYAKMQSRNKNLAVHKA